MPPITVVPIEIRELAPALPAMASGSVPSTKANIVIRIGHSRRRAAGSQVKRGDLLLLIDPRPFEASLAEHTAQPAQAEATLEFAKQEVERR